MQQPNPSQQTSRQVDQRTHQLVNQISLPASQIMSSSLLQQQFRRQSLANTPGASPNVTNETLMSPRNQNEQLQQAQHLTNLQFQQKIAQLNSVPSPPRPSPVIPTVQPSQLTTAHIQHVLSRPNVQNGTPFMGLTGMQDLNGMGSIIGTNGLVQGMQQPGLMRQNSVTPQAAQNYMMQQNSHTPVSTIRIAGQPGIVNPSLVPASQLLNVTTLAPSDIKRSPKSDTDSKDVKTTIALLSSSPKTPSQINTPPPSSPNGTMVMTTTTSHFSTPQSTGHGISLITPPPTQSIPMQHLSSIGTTVSNMNPYSITQHQSDQIRQIQFQQEMQNHQQQHLQAAIQQQQAQLQAQHQFQQQQQQLHQHQLQMQQQMTSQQLALQQHLHPVHMNSAAVLNQQQMHPPVQRIFQQPGPNAVGPLPLLTQKQSQPPMLQQGMLPTPVTIPNPALQHIMMTAAPPTTLVNNIVSEPSTNPSNIESVPDQFAQFLGGQFDQNFAIGSLTNDEVNESEFFDFDFEESLQETEPVLLRTSQSPQVPPNTLSMTNMFVSSPLARSGTLTVDQGRSKRSLSDVDNNYESELSKREKTAHKVNGISEQPIDVVVTSEAQFEVLGNKNGGGGGLLDNAETLALKQEDDGTEFLQF
ncbi:hypothetical protein HK096_006439 [Nowakowskiella sp. JEL0078]|nr:hypothetical protein HK096_006439 [Nowakowskiella sp. JEL0078]